MVATAILRSAEEGRFMTLEPHHEKPELSMALTAKEMNSKYLETFEGELAVSVVPC